MHTCAQGCSVWFQGHHELYINPPFLVSSHVIVYIYFSFAFTTTFYCCLLYATDTCYTFRLVPVTSGTTCTGLHTRVIIIRTPVTLCVVFWLGRDGRGTPIRRVNFYHFDLICTPFLTNLYAFTCLLPVPAPSKLCMWMATTLLVFDPNISLSHRVFEIYSVHVLFAFCMTS